MSVIRFGFFIITMLITVSAFCCVSNAEESVAVEDALENLSIGKCAQVVDQLKRLSKTDSSAEYNLGVLYLNGKCLNRDVEKAYRHFYNAANAGNADAQYNLGLMFFNGYAGVKDVKIACKWFIQSAARELCDAYFGVGLCSENGFIHTRTDYIDFYKTGAYCHDDNAMVALAVHYIKNRIDNEYITARLLLEEAYMQGNINAMFNLGNLYHRGYGVPRDYLKAIFYYKKSSDLGDAASSFNLHVIYRDGLGVKKNNENSKYFLKKAEKQGVKFTKVE